MRGEQLPLEHVHHRRRVLASRVVSLQVALRRCGSSTLEVDQAYANAERLSEDELVDIRRTLESEVAEKRRVDRRCR